MGNLHRSFLVEVKFWNLSLYMKYLWYICPQYLPSFAQLAVAKSDWYLQRQYDVAIFCNLREGRSKYRSLCYQHAMSGDSCPSSSE